MKNAFSINIIFLVLGIIGFALIPLLSVQLHPTSEGNSLYVSYSWNEVSAEIVEKEVTSPLEGLLASVRGIKSISSSSSKGYGSIILQFKDGVDIDAVRFEVGSLLMHVYTKLPEGVSRPMVGGQSTSTTGRQLLLTYTLNGEGSSMSLQKYADEHIVPTLGLIAGVDEVGTSGARPLEWELTYDKEELNALKVSINDIRQALNNRLQYGELGGGTLREAEQEQYIYLSFKGQARDTLDWSQLIVANRQGRLIHLNDLVKIKLKEQRARSYFRINGLNTIYLNIYSAKGANQIDVAKKAKDAIENLKSGFPNNFTLLNSFDASEQLEKESNKILSRSGLAIVILLLFVFLISRQWRYLFIIGISLVVNLSVAVIFFYWMSIDIHIYSLAGLTVSLGIIIDNTIVMVDHIRTYKNKRVFLAILAATLTTMGALSIIFFLKEHQQLNLIDFALVMLINLGVSLLVALFFIPALMDRFPLKHKSLRKRMRRQRLIVRVSNYYQTFITFSYKRKWWLVGLVIWFFGIPFHLLPDRLGTTNRTDYELKFYQRWYNQSLGNSTFTSDFKPWINKIIGGSLYYFSSYLAERGQSDDMQRSKLTVNVSMPDGATLEQMNELFLDLENFLAGFDEIERFVSRVGSVDHASINISFTEEAEENSFPYHLKQLIESKAIETGGADFGVFGVGRGFSNKLHEGHHNSSIKIRGYNYDELMKHARYLKKELLKHQRIKEVFIRTENSWRGKPRYEYVTDINTKDLAYAGSSLRHFYAQLSPLGITESRAGNVAYLDDFIPVVLRAKDQSSSSIWHLKHSPISGTERQSLRFIEVANITKERINTSINKTNQEYQLTVTYDFIGPYKLSERVLNRNIEMLNSYLPLGYSAGIGRQQGVWHYGESTQYSLLFLVIIIIYFICAILLESLLQPLAVIATIPLSFVGVFLSFTIFKVPFDQGGYASMVLLCGLTVNSALYIINDYNIYRRNKRSSKLLRDYIKAFNHKITPIILTILSTSLGLIPFLIGGASEGFWFSLAVGAIGGLFFSLLAIVLWLPLMMNLLRHRTQVN